MNDLDLMRSLGTDLDPAPSVPPAQLRQRVLNALADDRSNLRTSGLRSIAGDMSPREQRARTTWGLAAAASVAAIGLLATGIANNDTAESVGEGASGGTAEADGTGSQILLLAADRVAMTTAATGKYWRTTIEHHSLELAGAKGHTFKLDSGLLSDDWTARSESQTSRVLLKQLARTPATAADRTAWKRAGSPAKADVHYLGQDLKEGITKGLPLGVSSTEVIEHAARDSVKGPEAVRNGPFSVSNKSMSLKQIQDLPSDQRALRKVLLNNFERTVKDQQDKDLAPDAIEGWTEDRWLFSNAVDILTVPSTPKVKASVYRILAGLDSVQNLGQVTDVKGRSGNAVAIKWQGPEGLEQIRLVIDARTGSLLAEEERLLKPSKAMNWVTPNDVKSVTVITRAAWTNATPPAPTKGDSNSKPDPTARG